jgi:hypothetical protein
MQLNFTTMHNYLAADLGLELIDMLSEYDNVLDYTMLYDEDGEYNHDFINDNAYELPF